LPLGGTNSCDRDRRLRLNLWKVKQKKGIRRGVFKIVRPESGRALAGKPRGHGFLRGDSSGIPPGSGIGGEGEV
jgi:hypothetical protein